MTFASLESAAWRTDPAGAIQQIKIAGTIDHFKHLPTPGRGR